MVTIPHFLEKEGCFRKECVNFSSCSLALKPSQCQIVHTTKVKKGNLVNAKRLIGLIASCVLSTAYADLNDGLVAFYPFNGNAIDESGNGHNGTVNKATLAEDRFGRLSSAYAFTGSSDCYISVASTPALQMTTNLTISFWMNRTPVSTSGIIIAKGDAEQAYSVGFDTVLYNSGINFARQNSRFLALSTAPTPTNEWMQVVCTLNGTNAIIYYNGQFNTNGMGVTLGKGNGALTFGTIRSGTPVSFSGRLDDIRIYDRALSAVEVQELYEIEAPPSPLTEGLIGYYPFNGNADDMSGLSNNLIVTGASLSDDRFGSPDNAYYFNGTSDWMVSQNILPLSNSMPRTVSVWFKNENNSFYATSATTVGNPQIVGFGHKNWTGDGFAVSIGDNREIFQCSSYLTSTAGTNLYTDGRWYHVVMTTGGSSATLKIYLDGVAMPVYHDQPTTAPYLTDASKLRLSTFFDEGGIVNDPAVWWTHGFRGWIDDVRVYSRYLSEPEVRELYTLESGPRVDLIKAVKPLFTNLSVGAKYQLQISPDMETWTNEGSPFTATGASMVYPQYWDVDNWNSLYFRLQVVP